MKNKICIYTCITGNYDNLNEIKNKEKNIDYFCFTNNKKLKSNTWNIIYIDENISNILLARKIKILGHEIVNNYKTHVWIDAAIEFNKSINDFIKKYKEKDDDFVCFKHGERKSIMEEMQACLRFRKENISNIDKLKEFYKKENYKYDNGLIESTVFIRNPNTEKVKETMNIWYDILKKYSTRDQLSFNYAIFKSGLKVKYINEKVFHNEWFTWINHNSELIPKKYMIYYGNINEDYDYKKQIENNYLIKDNRYIIEEKILFDCKEVYVEVSNCVFLKYKILNNNYKVKLQNTIIINDWNVFFKNMGFIEIKNNFNKGDVLHLEFIFEEVDEKYKNQVIYNLIDKIIIEDKKIDNLDTTINDLKNKYKILEKSYNSILNSTSWKITQYIRKISNIIKK